MNDAGRIKGIGIGLSLLTAIVLLVVLLKNTSLGEDNTWQRLASPGTLSSPHAFLENNCSACHTSVSGVDSSKCISCHADNESILQRQPTAFHGNIGSCQECHLEHRGLARRPTDMDHEALTKIALKDYQRTDRLDEYDVLRKRIDDLVAQSSSSNRLPSRHHDITPHQAVLDCAQCHRNQDRHVGFFGRDCAQCHSTSKWTIPEFRHPSARSTDCAQCHQGPPSHYMGHFHMVSAKVAGKPHARVAQCYACHQTTSWNDIKGVGWYKHH